MDSQLIPDKRSDDDAKQREADHQRPQAELEAAATVARLLCRDGRIGVGRILYHAGY